MTEDDEKNLRAFTEWALTQMGDYVVWGGAAAAALAEIERLERELAETESRRDLAIANYVRTLAERDALTDRLIRAGLKA